MTVPIPDISQLETLRYTTEKSYQKKITVVFFSSSSGYTQHIQQIQLNGDASCNNVEFRYWKHHVSQKSTFKNKVITAAFRLLQSTVSRFGKHWRNLSIVVTFEKPRFRAISSTGPWPDRRMCLLSDCLNIRSGL